MSIRNRQFNQREFMRDLVRTYGTNKARVCEEFAAAEERGDFDTKRNPDAQSFIQYAGRLWREGTELGWLFRVDGKKQTLKSNMLDTPMVVESQAELCSFDF